MDAKVKINLLGVLKYTAFFGLFCLFNLAFVNNAILPFSFGFLFALVWCNQKIEYLAAIYLISAFLSGASMENLLITCCTLLAVTIFYFMHTRLRLSSKKWPLAAYAFLSQFAYLYFNLASGAGAANALVTVAIGILFMYACINILQGIFVRGFSFKFTIDEYICGGILLLAISIGLFGVQILDVKLIKPFAIFVILLTTYISGGAVPVLFASIIGLAGVFYNFDSSYIAIFSVWALVSSAFKSNNKYFSILAIIFIDVIMGYYLNMYSSYSIINVMEVVLGSLIFVGLVSNNIISLFAAYFSDGRNKLAIKSVVNRSRQGLCKRMNEMSLVFSEMDRVFRSMVRGVLPLQEAKTMLSQEVIDKVCGDCPNRHRCLRNAGEETVGVIEDITDVGFKKGKITILDIPPFLTSRCNRVNNIISAVNQLLVGYKQYANMVNNTDSSKILIAEQLLGVSKIMQKLSDETKRNVTFNYQKEDKLMEDLNYSGIRAREVVLYEQNTEAISITLVVKSENLDVKKMEKICSKACGGKMMINTLENAAYAGWSIVELKTAPKYDVVFGSAGACKNGGNISGDTYSFLKVGDDKFMLAICDGMGSGTGAEKASNLAISLVENFYKAGFENEIILSSVNRLLSLGNEEMFTALDVAIVDLRSSVCDFIKMGAPEGFIKNAEQVEIVNAGALPLGILEEMRPVITKKTINNSDMVILSSDGVQDSFGSLDDFERFLSSLSGVNPQTMAENILEKAIERSGGELSDDCTVMVARVFNRI